MKYRWICIVFDFERFFKLLLRYKGFQKQKPRQHKSTSTSNCLHLGSKPNIMYVYNSVKVLTKGTCHDIHC